MLNISLSSGGDCIRGRGLGKIGCKGKLGGVSRRKKAYAHYKVLHDQWGFSGVPQCVLGADIAASLMVVLQNENWCHCIILLLADTCQHTLSPSPKSLLSELNPLVNFHSFLSFSLFLNFDAIEFSLFFFLILLSFLRNGMNYLLRNSGMYFHQGTSVIRSGHMT